ncbi:MAG: acyl carrier protein [Rubrivivax sp.]|jgi:acyl carrier protein
MSSLKELQDLIQKKYGLDAATLDPNTSMRSSGVDSLALVEFLFEVEDHYGISVPEEHSGIDTLAELAAVVDQLVAAKATGGAAAPAPAPATDDTPAA